MTACCHFFCGLDEAFFYFVNVTLQNRPLDLLMPVLTTRENWYIPIAILWVGLLVRGGRKGRTAALLMIPLIILTDQTSSHLLKPLIHRSRPCNVLGGVHLHLNGQWVFTPEVVTTVFRRSFSFPSSHATNSFAAATLLSYAYRRWTPVCFLIASSVAYSRVYVGVHYPSDVAAGALLGTGFAFVFVLVWKRRQQRRGAGEQVKEGLGSNARRNGPP
jgi:undecaprenyl-diphosphatase